MSENTTPQMGSPEKEPLLKSEGTDQTSAEELLDQISANADDFPTVESILQEFGINTAEASGTQNEDAGTENMPERTSDTEEQEHAEPQETERSAAMSRNVSACFFIDFSPPVIWCLYYTIFHKKFIYTNPTFIWTNPTSCGIILPMEETAYGLYRKILSH